LKKLVWKDCEMSLQYFEEKKYYYQNVFLYLYCNIVCKNIVCDMGLTEAKDRISQLNNEKYSQ